ncbi:MAG: hypothetical protein Q8O56_15500 [Solirubrobacteraceae bacterium]|nr:hypothetical protein [Solirubrobacteraceae bacterium]
MTATPEETLAEEAQRRTKAGATAIAAGLLTMLGSLLVLTANDRFPSAGLLEALGARFGDSPEPGLVARKVLFYNDNVVAIVASQLVPAIALALIGVALTYLYRSTKARNPEVSKLPIIATVSGALFVIVPAIVAAAALTIEVTSFAGSADQSERAARDVLDSPLVAAAYYLVQLGTFALGLGFVFGALFAMRVGLLTRFMGVLGVIVGILFVFPLEAQLPLVKVFWLLALGALFLNRWPGGQPPAWKTGDARPWPTQQELREARMAERGEQPRGAKSSGRGAKQAARGAKVAAGAAVEEKERRPWRGRSTQIETPAPEPPPSKPHSSSKKKKRKRRR